MFDYVASLKDSYIENIERSICKITFKSVDGRDLRRIFQTLFQSFLVQKNKYIIIENVIDDCKDIRNKSKAAVYNDTQGISISTIGLHRNSIFTGVTEALYLFLSTISSNEKPNPLNWRFLKSSHTVASKRKDKPLAGNYSVLRLQYEKT